MTKKELFIQEYNQLPSNLSRKEAIAILSVKCGMTLAGASTYYSNTKNSSPSKQVKVSTKKAYKGISSTPESIAIVGGVTIIEDNGLTQVDGVLLNDLTSMQLSGLFSKYIPDGRATPKFSSLKDGIKKLVDMICE